MLSSISLCIFSNPTESIQIPLVVTIDDNTSIDINGPKSPTDPPIVYQDGHTLLFSPGHLEYVLRLVQNDQVVYSTIVSSADVIVMLPNDLLGEYELQLILGSYCFKGNIQL